MLRPNREFEAGGIQIAEEAVQLLRRAPASAWAAYALGMLPFSAGLIAFWVMIEVSPTAARDLPFAAVALALLFVWMQAWQARFAQHVRAVLHEMPIPPLTPRIFLRVAARQGLIQSSMLCLLPIAAVAIIPFAWLYGVAINACILEDGEESRVSSLLQRASAEARRNLYQAHLLLWLFSPFLLIMLFLISYFLLPVLKAVIGDIALYMLAPLLALLATSLIVLSPVPALLIANLLSGILAVAFLLKMFFDIPSVFTVSTWATISNSTFLAILVVLTCGLLSPFLKASYLLRCYYGESLQSGEDIRHKLRSLISIGKRTSLLVLFVSFSHLGFIATAGGEENNTAIDTDAFEQAIDQELGDAAYIWRLPAEDSALLGLRRENPVATWLESVRAQISDVVRWIFDRINAFFDRVRRFSGPMDTAGTSLSNTFYVVTVGVLLALIVGFLVRFSWRNSARVRVATPIEATQAPPNPADETVTPDALPSNDWMNMAMAYRQAGDLRLATRALFLAILAALAQRGLLRIARHKSNADYLHELHARAHAAPGAFDALRAGIRPYEAIWYGGHAATETGFESLCEIYRSVTTP